MQIDYTSEKLDLTISPYTKLIRRLSKLKKAMAIVINKYCKALVLCASLLDHKALHVISYTGQM